MNPSEPTFRAHKRRKVYRRRDEDDDEQSPVTTSATSATTPQHLGLEGTNGDHEDGRAQEPGNFGTGTDQQVPNDGEDASTVHSQRKPISGKPIPGKPRRGGIAFSHNSRPSSLRQPSPDTSTTLVPTNGEAEQQPKASMLETARSRFAPQTGAAINEGGDAQMYVVPLHTFPPIGCRCLIAKVTRLWKEDEQS